MDFVLSVTTTNKGKPSLVIDGFAFRIDKETKISNVWRCCKKTCPARCKTDKANIVVMTFSHDHVGHEPKTDKEIAVQQFRQNCKRKGADDLYSRPSKVMRSELEKDHNRHILPKDLESVRKAMYHERRKEIPKLPKNRDEIHASVGAFQLKTSQGENMIQINDRDSGIIIFSTTTNLSLLCDRNSVIFGDGTFDTCPKNFQQLYTIHAYQHHQYIQCAFCLLPSKSEETYRQMFTRSY